MSISDLLMSQKRWGRTRCRRLLVSLGVPENKQVGTLTERQRLALAAVLAAKNAPPGAEAGARERRPSARSAQPDRAEARRPRAWAPRSHRLAAELLERLVDRQPGPDVASSTMWPSGSRR